MKKELKKQKGITLVALVVTIIILLILAGISISALTQTGIFGKAKEAEQKSKESQEQENATLGIYEDILNEYDEKTLAYKVKNGIVKIGDYVKYTPETASTDVILQELNEYSGSNANTSTTLTQEIDNENGLNWRVLDVKNGQVRLISDRPTTSTIALSGAKGYNNAVYLLDKTCDILYHNTKLANKVQNLKIEDIQDHLTYDYKQYTNTNVDTGKYGGTKEYADNRNYPYLYAKEKTGWVDETQGTEINLSEQTQPVSEGNMQAKEKIKVTQTYWGKSMTENDFEKDKYYELFINRENNFLIYWISSRFVRASAGSAGFGLRNINDGSVSGYDLYGSGGGETPRNCAFRPVITLNSNVQIDTENSGNGSTAVQGYAIK